MKKQWIEIRTASGQDLDRWSNGEAQAERHAERLTWMASAATSETCGTAKDTCDLSFSTAPQRQLLSLFSSLRTKNAKAPIALVETAGEVELDRRATNRGTARKREQAALLASKVTMLASVPNAATLSALQTVLVSHK